MDATIRYVPVFGDSNDLALVDFDAGMPFSFGWEAADVINDAFVAADTAERAAQTAERRATRERLKVGHYRALGEDLAEKLADIGDYDPVFTGDAEEDYIDGESIDVAALNAAIIADRWPDPPYGATCLVLVPDWWETVGGAA